MPRITALTADPGDSDVLVELDGAPWRRIPIEIAARLGLATQAELGRTDLRRLGRELRRREALDTAARALRHRDRPRAAVRSRLARAGIAPRASEQALDALVRTGVLDDARYARNRARALADRGCGDALIRADLAATGVSEADATSAIGELEPQRERAIRLVAARGESLATARWLARKGFDEEAIEAALPSFVADQAC